MSEHDLGGVAMRSQWKLVFAVGAIIAAAVSFGGCGAAGETATVTVTQSSAPKSAEVESGESKSAEPAEPAATTEAAPEPSATTAQENALESAESYLEYSAFSEKGLVGQLKSEGFSTADAQYGASHSGADWNEQAVKSAESYLEYSSFSESGLVGQLKSEG
ncbi:MAG TPA: Ltp family lipoprotein, partial [Solirubrobacterales bacterium]|nr:Ltp family lipoprotein [Solirubrobacterales bacterium]